MAEKLEVRELASDEFPETQLRYAVYDEFEKMVSVHFWEEDARKMAAVSLMMKALEESLTYVVYQITKYNENEYELGLAERMIAAIAAAKGE